MKIGLVAVLGGDLVRSAEHVGLGLIASYLREHHFEVRILEIRDGPKPEKYGELLSDDFSIVGFTTTCITLESVLETAAHLKRRRKGVKVVLGGHMATFSGEEILEKYGQVDYIIRGEGEITFHELAECVKEQRLPASVKGLIYRDGSKIVRNEDRELIPDLDKLPFASRDQFLQNPRNTQYMRISTSRGCFGHCAFCSSFVGRKQEGPAWRGRSPKNVVDELQYLVERYDFHTFDFVDSTFEDPGKRGKKRIGEIAQEIRNRGLKIYYNCCFRAENWKEGDKQLLKLLMESGLEKVNIGFESGNDRGLVTLNKRARMKDNFKVLEVLRDFPDIYITFGFIMLHPYSTREDLYDNAVFLHATGIGQVIRHYFWQLEVYPGTLMEEKLIKDRLLAKEYDIIDGMYCYRFADDRVKPFVSVFKELLKVKAVWDFEIFDIVIHTFITRLRREYRDTAAFKQIEEFRRYVGEERAEMADFNLEFFMGLYQAPDKVEIEKEKARLDCYIKEKMNKIRAEQYKLGHELIRSGMRLVNR